MCLIVRSPDFLFRTLNRFSINTFYLFNCSGFRCCEKLWCNVVSSVKYLMGICKQILSGKHILECCFIDRVTTNPFSWVSVYTCTWTDVVTCRRQFLDWHARFIFLAFFICFLEVKYSNAVSVAMFLLQSGLNEEALYRTFHEHFLQNIN